ncbi:hypothetical protein [Streptomyces triticiradicis]|uniref:Uncharacterized protein n=1 Tax=Streptomyces triticiradicis TaxID=2651189 RepID=A0A7J5D975_9ACTN|nr:hypothetical protein [Streptomyces triticiradicis]KAB1983411.1 hypothetical protein F8144_29080 [Streptomyces triticiradicis]
MSTQSASERIDGSVLVLVTGLIADASATALFLISSDTRAWLKTNYFLVSLTTLALFAAAVGLLNVIISQREKISHLHQQLEQVDSQCANPTAHDAEMFKAVNDHASPQKNFIVWLREGFLVTRASVAGFRDLENVITFFEREPRGFDDEDLNAKYRRFVESGRGLVDKITDHMWYEGEGLTRLEIPREWERTQPERLEEAMREIGEAHDLLMASYDAFFVAAQQKGLFSAIGSPSSS